MAVLPQPHHAVPPAHAGVGEGAGQAVGAVVELGIGEPDLSAHHRPGLWAATTVFGQDAGQGEEVGRLRSVAVAADAAPRPRSHG